MSIRGKAFKEVQTSEQTKYSGNHNEISEAYSILTERFCSTASQLFQKTESERNLPRIRKSTDNIDYPCINWSTKKGRQFPQKECRPFECKRSIKISKIAPDILPSSPVLFACIHKFPLDICGLHLFPMKYIRHTGFF